MEQKYDVLDTHGQPCGSLKMAICADYAALDKVMRFGWLETLARYHQLTDPASFGFKYFEKQLPRRDIYPVAALLDLEIERKKRGCGNGATALGAFSAEAANYHARLGLLLIGNCGGEEYDKAMLWRKGFYSKHGWVAFNTPSVPGLMRVWMYHLLPPPSDEEWPMRNRLKVAAPEQNEFVPLE